MEIKTKYGTLVITESPDPYYPGVWVDFAPLNSDLRIPVAGVEFYDSPTLVTHVWGDAMQEDCTHSIIHENIDRFVEEYEQEDE